MNEELEKIPEDAIIIKNIYNIQLLEYSDSFVLESMHQNDWRLLCVYRDEVKTLLNGKWVSMLVGHLVLIPPDVPYGLKISDKSHPEILLISLNCTGKNIREIAGVRLHLNDDDFSILNEILSIAKFAFNIGSNTYDQLLINKTLSSKNHQILKNKLELLLLGLLESPERSTTYLSQPPATMLSRQMLVNNINSLLLENIAGTVTLAQLSSTLNFSPSYLNNVYRTETGKSIIAAFNEMKIDRAKKLIEKSEYCITQISELLGFSSVHYFSRAFKKVTEMTPSEYSAQVRGKGSVPNG